MVDKDINRWRMTLPNSSPALSFHNVLNRISRTSVFSVFLTPTLLITGKHSPFQAPKRCRRFGVSFANTVDSRLTGHLGTGARPVDGLAG